jgi:hypothetical protein
MADMLGVSHLTALPLTGAQNKHMRDWFLFCETKTGLTAAHALGKAT